MLKQILTRYAGVSSAANPGLRRRFWDVAERIIFVEVSSSASVHYSKEERERERDEEKRDLRFSGDSRLSVTSLGYIIVDFRHGHLILQNVKTTELWLIPQRKSKRPLYESLLIFPQVLFAFAWGRKREDG